MASLEARLKQHRPQQAQALVEVHRLRLAFPSTDEIAARSCAEWTRQTGQALQQVSRWLWQAEDGTGVLLTRDNFGAMPGDGVDMHVHFLLPGDIHTTFALGMDYSQRELTVHAAGPEGTDLEPALSRMASLAFLLRIQPLP